MKEKSVKVRALANGVVREVYLRPQTESTNWPLPAKTYVGKTVVSGRLAQDPKTTALTFTPIGSNSHLV